MLSDKIFSAKEFEQKIPEFAQAVANKVPGSEVRVAIDPLTPNSVIVSIAYNSKSQHTQLHLTREGRVEMNNIFGHI